jgi:MIP family channel proteins
MIFSYWKRCVAEALGTFGFFFIGFSGIALSVTQPTQIGPVAIAVGFGLGLALMIFAFGHISGGHFNPAVTVALVVGRRFPIREVVGYWLAQLVGGAVAAATVIATFGDVVSAHLVTAPGPGTTTMVALVLETIVTALFVVVISAVATDRAPWSGTFAPVAIGGFIATAAMVIGPASGGSFNPARSLAPALFVSNVSQLWIYMVGPFAGAIIGGFVYWLIRADEVHAEPEPAELADDLE